MLAAPLDHRQNHTLLTLVQDLRWVNDNWVADYDNASRIIVMAHSHGDVWAHTALFVVDDIPVDFLIDIDGESTAWEDEYALQGDDWYWVIAEYGATWPYDIGNAADSWDIPGQPEVQDVEDVVPDNMLFDLESKASGWEFPILNDDEVKHRLDGSEDDIYFIHSTRGHSDVCWPTSDAMTWAFDVVEDAYF